MFSVHWLLCPLVSISLLASAHAQDEQPTAGDIDAINQATESLATSDATEENDGDISEDEMADLLNSRQQLQQTVTFTRTIDGEVVETVQETITYSDDDPIQSTEAGTSIIDQMKEKFDRAALTRNEAFEEAKLDFVVADVDRNNIMTADEFVILVTKWRADQDGHAVEEVLNGISIGDDGTIVRTGNQDLDGAARQKFVFMSGMTEVLSQRDYIREYLTDFDAFDANGDSYLNGDELEGFRKANRGENS